MKCGLQAVFLNSSPLHVYAKCVEISWFGIYSQISLIRDNIPWLLAYSLESFMELLCLLLFVIFKKKGKNRNKNKKQVCLFVGLFFLNFLIMLLYEILFYWFLLYYLLHIIYRPTCWNTDKHNDTIILSLWKTSSAKSIYFESYH